MQLSYYLVRNLRGNPSLIPQKAVLSHTCNIGDVRLCGHTIPANNSTAFRITLSILQTDWISPPKHFLRLDSGYNLPCHSLGHFLRHPSPMDLDMASPGTPVLAVSLIQRLLSHTTAAWQPFTGKPGLGMKMRLTTSPSSYLSHLALRLDNERLRCQPNLRLPKNIWHAQSDVGVSEHGGFT